ncbi:hypothetical protein [Pseudooctadecabacter sp.]|uniref:hypothetical protein n=1 Tax=Pseudooctadecabacter sp. TaxID=1966338 RepID=UPI0035C793DA
MIRNLIKVTFFPLFGRIKSKPKQRALPPLKSARVHLFAGTFTTEVAATDYALGLSGDTLAADLGNVAIGPDDIEIIFGAERIAAARPMFHFAGPVPATKANTYFMLSDRGYDAGHLTGGRVAYLGLCDVS